jgi:hypothetical protein
LSDHNSQERILWATQLRLSVRFVDSLGGNHPPSGQLDVEQVNGYTEANVMVLEEDI